MIIYTKNSTRLAIPPLFAYAAGVWAFPFYGDETYTDPYDDSIWTWERVTNTVDQITGVTFASVNYTPVIRLVDCTAVETSFFWDDTNGILYVHHANNVLDLIYGTAERVQVEINAGYATGYNKVTRNMYDNIYYDTLIEDFTEIKRAADPLQYGLVSFNDLAYSLINTDGAFDGYTEQDAVGAPFFVYATGINQSVSALGQTEQIFQGYHVDAGNNRKSLTIKGVESRFFQNVPVCVNKFTAAEFANIDDISGQLKPVAFGQIRRGIAVPTNIGALTTALGSVVLLLADPAFGPILSVTAVYDKDGNSLSITATDLTACTVTVTKPAGINPDETKDYSWSGQGYSITGTYNNGLDIIKSCFLYYSNLLYNSTFFDTVQWAAQTAIKTEAVGISVQSDKGWIEEILQPVSVALQGIFEFKGNGQLTFFPRQFTGGTPIDIEYTDIIDDTSISIKNELISEIAVEYAPDFQSDKALVITYDGERAYVINTYNTDTRGDISPLRVILFNEADARTVAENYMSTYKDPGRYYTIYSDTILDLDLFDLVRFNNKRFYAGTDELITAEVLSISLNYLTEKTALNVRKYRG